MSEEKFPVAETAADVAEKETVVPAEAPVEEVAQNVQPDEAQESAEALSEEEVAEEIAVNLAELTLAELSVRFEELAGSEDRMTRSKEAEAIKAAFYKKLSKEKVLAGLASEEAPAEEAQEEAPVVDEEAVANNPFSALEEGFKAIYNKYKKERAEYNRQIEKEREDNLVKKQAVVDELKALVETQDDASASFPQFRELQARWRATGPVPAQNFRIINDTYQLWVEKFYDKVQISRDLRDLDFKKNLEAKEAFCEAAEKLAESENVVNAFRELQKLHEQWKEFGPVAKEYREQIWERFKAATAIINKKHQAYFEGLKDKQAENLAAKTVLCEKVEAIAAKEDIKTSNEWNSLSKEIEDIQKEWRKIGFASKKDNQKIYDRFRAACDKFFERKRVYYTEFKDSMNANMDRKMAIIAEAEALKTSTEWKKTADRLIELQKEWKEIGAVPRKKSEVLWKRFRAACDEFFAERDKQAKPENDYYGNLKAKKAIIAEIQAYQSAGDAAADQEAYEAFAARWQAIGFVPFKEKDAIAAAYKDAVKAKFPERGGRSGRAASAKAPKSEKERLVAKYTKLQQEIDTYENNIGFFAAGKGAALLIQQMQDKIAAAKAELKELENQIRNAEAEAE